MNDIHIITYATHSEGKFDELINNNFNVSIEVIGWGKKWNGFMDKFKNMYEYIQTLPDNDIIIFIDGFDTEINQPLDVIKQRFLEFNSDIVLSEHPKLLNNYVTKKFFGTCQGDLIANSGLYGGYNIKLQELLKHILKYNDTSDDQQGLNSACKYFDNIIIDTEKKLFHNLNYSERYLCGNFDSCFLSTPGDLSFNRLIRFPKEYFPFFWKEIVLFIFIIILIGIFIKNHTNN